MTTSNYIVAVVVATSVPQKELVDSIQSAYNAGAAGFFETIDLHNGSFMVLMERDTADGEDDYLVKRMREQGINAKTAAQQQLADEIGFSDTYEIVQPIVETLRKNQGRVITFGSDVLDSLDEAIKPERLESALAEVVAGVKNGGEYPDLEWSASQKWKVDTGELRQAYDSRE